MFFKNLEINQLKKYIFGKGKNVGTGRLVARNKDFYLCFYLLGNSY